METTTEIIVNSEKGKEKDEDLIALITFRNIVLSQLYLISPVLVTKNIFDRVHKSMILRDSQKKILGGICFYEIKRYDCVSIVYFAIDSENQSRGLGNILMGRFKGTFISIQRR